MKAITVSNLFPALWRGRVGRVHGSNRRGHASPGADAGRPRGGVTRFHRDRRESRARRRQHPHHGHRAGARRPGGGNDPYELFRWFFGPDFQPPGPAPGQRRKQPQPQPEERTIPRGVGRAFISADGYILTNNHVISDATDIYVTLTDGREFKAKVIGSTIAPTWR